MYYFAMKSAVVLLALSLPLFVSYPCLAQQDDYTATGAGLQEICSGNTGGVEFGSGYGLGFARGVLFAGVLSDQVCSPDAVTIGEAKQVMVKYLNDHPETLHEPTTRLALRAFPRHGLARLNLPRRQRSRSISTPVRAV